MIFWTTLICIKHDLIGQFLLEKNTVPHGYPAATDGYWLMVSPRPPGEHTIKFKARYTKSPTDENGVMIQDIEYKFNVM